MIQLMMQKKE